ncbi:putative inactive purple acid phosphatase 16 [Vanrija pseudolonga]|uniref:Inactive purple acid phosphatase 16 n=1 Tax=Vanrija pseudolonga TaxID=143232 RepID=A0AAF1BKK9_9TREE|nr:putative inactive purple acid phosphatase 16 [Vanrija pseudolonga]
MGRKRAAVFDEEGTGVPRPRWAEETYLSRPRRVLLATRALALVTLAAVAMVATLLLLSTLLASAAAAPRSFPKQNNDCGDALNPYPDGRRLTFNKDGTFKVVLFTDLHYGERDGGNVWAEWGVEQDTNSTRVMNYALDDESPNLIVYGGDQITGENQLWENSTVFLDEIFAPALAHNTPFTTIYGNHDESYNISHVQSFWYEKTRAKAKKLSWTQMNDASSDDPKGVFNYYIPVYAHDNARVPALLLWFFDSRSGTFNSGYFNVTDEKWMSQDWVDPKAATWINGTAAQMKEQWGSLPKSLVYVHIPPSPAQAIGNDTVAKDPEDHPGINYDEPVDIQGQNGAAFWGRNTPDKAFWNAVTGTLGGSDGSGLIAVTSGHDHGNDWCGRDDSVGPFTFCFGRHTGYGGYGNWARGSRVWQARLDTAGALGDLKSWIRMEDHSTANTTTLVQNGQTTLINSHDPAPK